MKLWLMSSVCAGLVLAVGGEARAEKDRYEVGEEIPSFTLKAVNGEDLGETYISIDRYFGAGAKDAKKALILSFFATYCEPCKREMPMLAALFDAYKAAGLQVVMVSIDKDADKIEVAKSLAKENGVKFPVLADRFNIVAKRYFVSKLPNLYLVGGDGKVLLVNVGYNDDVSKKLVEETRKAVGEATSSPIPEAVQKHMAKAGSGAPETVSVPTEDGGAPAGGAPASGTLTPATGDAGAAPAAAADDDGPAKGKGKGKGKAKGKGKGKGK